MIARAALLVLALSLASGPAAADPARFAEGMRLHEGDGVLPDHAAAAAAFRAAAEAGHAQAQAMLGRYYHAGLGVPQDRAEALRWLEAAAAQGDPEHIFDLAQVVEQTPQGAARAAELYQLAANAGLSDAAVNLGVMYQEGRGVARDPQRARALYEGPAAQGHPRAMNNLGLIYVRGTGVEQDYARAATLFSAAAELGLAQAMANLAVLYENGFGVPLDEARAAELYRAAGGAATPAPITFAFDERIAQPDAQAADAISRAARDGDPIAQLQWSFLVLTTPDQSPANMSLAARIVGGMARSGHSASMYNLGLLHMRGQGVAQDYVLGHAWLLLARSRGVAQADAALNAFRTRLTAEQINAAQAFAAEQDL